MRYKLKQRLITSAESKFNDHYVVADNYEVDGLHLIVEGHFHPHLSSVIDYVVKNGNRPTHYRVEDYEQRLIEKSQFAIKS
ncbi:hypothetical protein HQ489_04240 [Candidatus Woesearchaeota archaeon]|nr:hypothetical protein [Candidatus Woesearchaeota archaeon]